MELCEREAALLIGADKTVLRRARLAGVVNPRRDGRAYLYSARDVEILREHIRPAGLCAKQAAAILGIKCSTLSRYRRAGKVIGKPAGGVTRVRYVYARDDLAKLRHG